MRTYIPREQYYKHYLRERIKVSTKMTKKEEEEEEEKEKVDDDDNDVL